MSVICHLRPCHVCKPLLLQTTSHCACTVAIKVSCILYLGRTTWFCKHSLRTTSPITHQNYPSSPKWTICHAWINCYFENAALVQSIAINVYFQCKSKAISPLTGQSADCVMLRKISTSVQIKRFPPEIWQFMLDVPNLGRICLQTTNQRVSLSGTDGEIFKQIHKNTAYKFFITTIKEDFFS